MSSITNTGKLAGRTVYISGASRGIGREIALKLAKDRANIIIAGKTAEPHPKLSGTIYTVAEEVEAAGGNAFPCVVDIRDEHQVQQSVENAVSRFGGIDVLINNAGAISLTNTMSTEMKRFDLLHAVNARGAFLLTKFCLPYLKKGRNPHILNVAPPLSLKPHWFKDHLAYTTSKYCVSLMALGWAEEFKSDEIGVNCLWPATAVYTTAIDFLGVGVKSQCRKAEIMGDAAYAVLTRDGKSTTGYFFTDESVLREEGIDDFSVYAYDNSMCW